MRRLRDLATNDLVEGVDALALWVEGEHEMHSGGTLGDMIFVVCCWFFSVFCAVPIAGRVMRLSPEIFHLKSQRRNCGVRRGCQDLHVLVRRAARDSYSRVACCYHKVSTLYNHTNTTILSHDGDPHTGDITPTPHPPGGRPIPVLRAHV